MDNKTREQLKQVIAMTDGKELLRFAKSYATKDEAFAKAIINKFLPKEEAVPDIDKAVKACFQHRKKGRQRLYAPSLDWAAIRLDIKRLLKQLDFLRKQHKDEVCGDGALLLLETLNEEFVSDHQGDYYNAGSNYGHYEALKMIEDIIANSEDVTDSWKRKSVARLKKLTTNSIYTEHLYCDIKDAVERMQMSLLSPDDMLSEIDKNIAGSAYSTDKAKYVKKKIDLLRQMGRNAEAEKSLKAHLDLEGVCEMHFAELVNENRNEEAKAFCRATIERAMQGRNEKHPWYRRLLQQCRITDDAEGIREAASWLFIKGGSNSEERKDYYYTLRETYSNEEWEQERMSVLANVDFDKYQADMLFEIIDEEHLYGLVYDFLQKLPNYTMYSYEPYQNCGGQRLAYFAKYARHLTEKERDIMEAAFFDDIKRRAEYASTRDGYAAVAKGLHYLGMSGEKGSRDARMLAAKILRDNPNRPAYREEINKYDY